MTSQPNKNRGRSPGKKRNERGRMIIMIVLAVIMALLAAVCVLYSRWVRKPSLPSAESPKPVVSGDPQGGDQPDDPEYDPVQPKVSGERKSQDFYTILVFGTDESSGLTDTMMVVSYDVTNQQATVMSIPRDTLVNVRSYNKQINAVYSNNGKGEQGINALKNEVSELVGFMPDYYVQIDWELVGQMVDAIDGVYFDVPLDMWYQDPYQDLYIDLKAGYQKLNGDQAMQLVRWRKNMDPNTFKIVYGVGDVERLKIQQDFLKSVLKQTLQLKNVTRISQLAKLFGENVVSDLTIENLFWFGSQAIFGGLSVDNVNFVTMPYLAGVGDYANRVYPNWNGLLTLTNSSLNPFVDEVTLRELDLIRVNSDGTLSSSTGVLADPAAGIPKESPEPSSDPEVSDDPEPTESGGMDPNPDVSDEPPVPEPSEDPEPTPDPEPTEIPTSETNVPED